MKNKHLKIKEIQTNRINTLADIARCLMSDRKIDDRVELILQATIEYNSTTHS